MAASSISKMSIASSRLNVGFSCVKEVLGGNSSEDNDVTACSTSMSECKRRVENESWAWSPLDVSLWNMLNSDLTEKIIARLPFKSFFRAPVLSKAWSQKLLNHRFQSEVLRSSSTWESYCPLFVNDRKELIGYGSGSQQWHRLATESYFPSSTEGPCPFLCTSPFLVVQRDWTWTWHLKLMAVGGSIVCWMWMTDHTCGECTRPNARRPPPVYLCVSNPLMKSWKQLPPCPHTKLQYFGCDACRDDTINVHVDSQGTDSYQVVVIDKQEWDICIYIFDSRSSMWRTDKYQWKWHQFDLTDGWSQSVYMNGVIYLGCPYWVAPSYRGSLVDTPKPLISFDLENKIWIEQKRSSLISFDMRNKMWTEQNLSISQQEGFINHLEQKFELVVCGSNVMLVAFPRSKTPYERTSGKRGKTSGQTNLCVYRLDLEFGLAFAVSTAPKNILDFFSKEVGYSFYCARGVADCIHLNDRFGSNKSLIYNVTTRKWDWILPPPDKFGPFLDASWRQLPCPLTAYQPGLNPFLEV